MSKRFTDEQIMLMHSGHGHPPEAVWALAEEVMDLRTALEDCVRAASGLTSSNAVAYIRGRATAALPAKAS